MSKPTTLRITGPRLREKRPCLHACYRNNEKLVYVWPTKRTVNGKIVKENLTIREMSKITDIKAMTIYTRIRRYGHDHPDVFSAELLLHGNGLNYGAMPSGKAKKTIEQVGAGSWEAANL